MEGGLYGLLGSGEFLPWAEEADRWLVERAGANSQRVLVAPTACAPEGEEVWDRWASMGLEHYKRIGLEAEVLPLRDREDAHDPAVVAALEGASEVFFSGGNPAYLADVLRASPFWYALLDAVRRRSTALAGCSAGAMVLGERALDSTVLDLAPAMFHPGLAVFPGVEFAVHWDAVEKFAPGLQRMVRDSITPGRIRVFIDERTGIVGDGDHWLVMGLGTVTVGRGEKETVYTAGQAFAFSEVPVA